MRQSVRMDFCSDEKVRCPMEGMIVLEGMLNVPLEARGIVIVAVTGHAVSAQVPHAMIADELQRDGWATLVMPLLTVEEEILDRRANHLRYNIELLSRRLATVTGWILQNTSLHRLSVSYWGSGSTAAAAIAAAVQMPQTVFSLVSYGGRPDLAEEALAELTLPLLCIVRQEDVKLVDIHRDVLRRITTSARLTVLEKGRRSPRRQQLARSVARLSSGWFEQHIHSTQAVAEVS